MKKINWNFLFFTCMICLLPICLGMYFYEELPETMAIHFNIENKPDGFASKNFTLFGLPFIMIFLQASCCIISDINENKKGNPPMFIKIVKWIVPLLTIVIYTLTILVGLGKGVDIGKIVCIFLGIIFIVTGNYMPKISYEDSKNIIKPRPKNVNVFKKMMRLLGYTFVVGGITIILAVLVSNKFAFISVMLLCLITFVESIYFLLNEK